LLDIASFFVYGQIMKFILSLVFLLLFGCVKQKVQPTYNSEREWKKSFQRHLPLDKQHKIIDNR